MVTWFKPLLRMPPTPRPDLNYPGTFSLVHRQNANRKSRHRAWRGAESPREHPPNVKAIIDENTNPKFDALLEHSLTGCSFHHVGNANRLIIIFHCQEIELRQQPTDPYG